MVLPLEITAGDTLKFTEVSADYLPEDGYALRYVLVSGSSKITLDSIDNGDGSHLFDIDIATTAAWASGSYSWQEYAVKGSTERYSVDSGTVEILADFDAVATSLDARSEWQTILDNLMAAYVKLTKTSAVVVTVSVAGRSTTFRDAEDLLVQITNARQQVKREQQEQALRDGQPSGNRLQFRL